MRLAQFLCVSIISLVVSLVGTAAGAQEIALPAAAPAESATPVTTPERGASMAQVEARYGAPTQRNAAIGDPPITRWDYPGFSVFFEYQHVVHSVVK
jgi:hypothetical protein